MVWITHRYPSTVRLLKQSFHAFLARLGTSQQADDVLRVGRHAVQRWVAVNAAGAKNAACKAMSLQASAELSADAWSAPPSPASWPIAALTEALRQIYLSPPQGSVEVVLESTWLPVMLVQTGGVLVSEGQAVALLRHRLAQLYDSPSDPVALWDVRVSFNPGDALALGYGLSPQVSSALNQAATRLGFKFTRLTPAWAWGWQRAQADGCFAADALWWGWQEQDRLLLGLVEGEGAAAQLKSLHPGLARSVESEHLPPYLAQTVRSEAQRLGLVDVPKDMCIGTWAPQGCRVVKHSCKITP
jgi:hypothetical protein